MLRTRLAFSLRPPAAGVKAPLPLQGKIPDQAPDGARIDPQAPSLREVEAFGPPRLKAPAGQPEGWIREGAAWHWHEGLLWGRWGESRWAWLQQDGRRWWLNLAAGQMLWHASHWWWKKEGLWFVLHEGEPWGYRHLRQWGQEGFFHAESGAQMIYSKDESRVLLVSPGEDGVIFDARDGRELGVIAKDKLPQPARPKPAPKTLGPLP